MLIRNYIYIERSLCVDS